MNKVSYDRIEEIELAPGLVMTVRREDSNLMKTIERFVHRKGSISKLKEMLGVRGYPKSLDRVMSSRRVMANSREEE